MIELVVHPPGTFCFIEAGTPDIESSNGFYAGVFGWEVDDRSSSDGARYTRFLISGRPVAGLYEISSEQEAAVTPAQWLSYVSVVDAAATLAKAIELEATALGEMVEVPDVVTVAEFVDPEGAICGLWQPGSYVGANFVGEPGTLAWVDVLTANPIGAAAFYSRLFDWTFEAEETGSGIYRSGKGGNPVAGATTITPEMGDVLPAWRAHVGVTDLDRTRTKISDLGGSVGLETTPVAGFGRRITVKDPAGISFMLIEAAQSL